MNYADLQVVIKEVCTQTDCPGCRLKYKADEIYIVGTTKNEGTFMAKCEKCGYNVVINVSVTRKTESNIKPHVRDFRPTKISSDEVLDMTNFLKAYQGDVYNLLK